MKQQTKIHIQTFECKDSEHILSLSLNSIPFHYLHSQEYSLQVVAKHGQQQTKVTVFHKLKSHFSFCSRSQKKCFLSD